MDGVSAAANTIAVVQLLERVATLCIQYGKAVGSAKADIERLQGELGRLKTVLGDAQKLLDSPNGARLSTSQAFCGMLKDCSSQLGSVEIPLQEKIAGMGMRHKAMSRWGIRALKWPFQSEDVTRIVEDLKGCRDALSASLTIDQTRLLLDHFERVDEAECREILEWVSRVPYGKHHDLVKEIRTSGTCEWLLQHEKFGEWESASKSVILWLQGLPGAGKTFLASKVIDRMQNRLKQSPDKEGFAFFYCNRNEQERRDPHSVLRSYVRQLATPANRSEEMRKKLHSLWRKATLKGSELSLAACQEQLLESVNLYHRTTIVLDALDECDPGSRVKLVETLEFLLDKAEKPLRLFVSSRPDRDIRKRFLEKPNIEIQAGNNQSDISKFVDEEIVKHEGWSDMSPTLREDIVKVLLSRSDGMFQWAFLQIKQILELETEAAIRDRLGKLPPTLKAAYDEIYEKINTRNKHDRALTERAFKWVMCAREPLTSEALLAAVRLDPESDGFELSDEINEAQLLHLCNNLLLIDAQRATWRVSHLSVVEYFEQSRWTLPQAHCLVAKTCLKLLLETLWDTGREAFDDIFNERNHALRRYVEMAWIGHIQAVEEQAPDGELAVLLKAFLGSFKECSPQYQRWHSFALNCQWLYQPDSTFRVYSSTLRFLELRHEPKSNLSHCGTRFPTPEGDTMRLACTFSMFTLLSDWWAGAEINISGTNSSGQNALVLAACGGSIPICRALIQRGVDSDMPAEAQQYGLALEAAVAARNFRLVEFMIERDPEANMLAGARRINTALVTAVRDKQIKMVKFLVSKGADVNGILSNGKHGNALVAAVDSADMEILRFLVDQGAEINTLFQDMTYGSALATAAKHWSLEAVKFLVERGAKINLMLQGGMDGSALAAAAAAGHLDVVKFLVERGAEIDMVLQSGRHGSALAAAAAAGDIKVVQFLVERGAEINRTLHSGGHGSALAAAVSASRALPIVKFLLDRGAEPNMLLKTGHYGSALATAARLSAISGTMTEVIDVLIDGGAEVNLALDHGQFGNALACAVHSSSPISPLDTVELLIRRGADVNMPLEYGEYGSVLAAASDSLNRDVFKLLVERGAKATQADRAG